MKISTKRLLSLLLALVMALSLSPTALLEGVDGDGDDDGGGETPGGQDRLSITLAQGVKPISPESGIVLAQEGRAPDIKATISARNSANQVIDTHDDDHIIWTSNDPETVEVHNITEDGRTFYVQGKKPGIARIEGKVTDPEGRPTGATGDTISFPVTVSGILPAQSAVTIVENNSQKLPDAEVEQDSQYGITYYGNAKDAAVTITRDRPNVVKATGNDRNGLYIDGVTPGTGIVTIQAGIYSCRITVTVTSNETTIEWKEGVSVSKPLKFSALESLIAEKCQEAITAEGDKTLVSITGLSVSPSQGTLYLGYVSPENTGAGAGSSMTYYVRTAARGPYIQDITFVPNPSFTGETATISYTGTAANNRTFRGKVIVTLTQEKTDLTVFTKRDTPLKLSSTLFSKSCQEQTGAPLSYVVFTLPPANQGSLYLGYKDEWDYASKVSANEQYKQKQLDDMTFVPAQGFVGTVTVSYAGYSASGSRYNGQLVIQVKQGLDDAITYNGDGAVSFSRYDFEDFCKNETGRELSSVSFTPPPASQGTLYYSWNGLRGSAVTSNDAYGPSQIDRLTFVAADGFHGVVRIPFTGTDRSGETFTGTVEVHIQSVGTTRGDVSYVCAPGQSVKLNLSDFTALCQTLTGQRLHYVSFQSLPDFHMGTLYHNRTSSGSIGTRVTTATKYFNSATPYLSNLSFWATESFRGGVEIPFTGCAVSGETFTAILYISSGEGAGSGSSAAVQYTVTSGGSVTFSGKDFDDACRQATNAALSYLRFDLPSSGQGILYYDYRAGSTPKALNPATDLYRSGEVSIDRVTFVPAKSFAGIASVPFTAWAIDGTEYRGMAEITVRSEAALGGLVRYQTGGAPVHISAADIQSAAGEQPSSLRLTGLPNASQGKLYYQYAGPTQYSWQGNTTTEYSLYGDPSVSNLTFVPKAGYTGTVEIPYAAATSSGGYAGTIRITVSAPNSSVNFDDLDGYSAQTKAAVDYLSSIGVVNGTGYRTYEPGASIRRGDFCVMLSRAFQFNVGGSGGGFTDVPAGAYYASAVNDLYALGIVNGVGGGRFQPSATLSRQDAALMIQRTLNQAGIEIPDGNSAALAAYSDRGQVADYARGAVAGLAQLGLLPTRNSRLSPKANLTRADMALLLHRAMTQ